MYQYIYICMYITESYRFNTMYYGNKNKNNEISLHKQQHEENNK